MLASRRMNAAAPATARAASSAASQAGRLRPDATESTSSSALVQVTSNKVPGQSNFSGRLNCLVRGNR